MSKQSLETTLDKPNMKDKRIEDCGKIKYPVIVQYKADGMLVKIQDEIIYGAKTAYTYDLGIGAPDGYAEFYGYKDGKPAPFNQVITITKAPRNEDDWQAQRLGYFYSENMPENLTDNPETPHHVLPWRKIENYEELKKFYAEAVKDGFEGLVIKDLGIKIKKVLTMDLVLLGYKKTKRSSQGGCLVCKVAFTTVHHKKCKYPILISQPGMICPHCDSKGEENRLVPLISTVVVGSLNNDGTYTIIANASGISDHQQIEFNLGKEIIGESTEHVFWKPDTVVEIEFMEITKRRQPRLGLNGKLQWLGDKESVSLRHPRYMRIREDKSIVVEDVGDEQVEKVLGEPISKTTQETLDSYW